jgi:hypothetical protein
MPRSGPRERLPREPPFRRAAEPQVGSAAAGDARNHSHFRQENVACDVVFVGLACALASKVDGPVSRSPSNLAASAIDKCGQIRNEDVDEPVNASHAVNPVHRPPDATDIVGCCVVAPERGTHDAPRLFLAQTATHGGHCASTVFRAYQFPLVASLRISMRGPARQPSS